jgi:hypothetical protein
MDCLSFGMAVSWEEGVGLTSEEGVGLTSGKGVGLTSGKGVGLASGKGVGLTSGKGVGVGEGFFTGTPSRKTFALVGIGSIFTSLASVRWWNAKKAIADPRDRMKMMPTITSHGFRAAEVRTAGRGFAIALFNRFSTSNFSE